jgi:alkylation response protein AidB-like acyl-CoA dehydrogenase
VALEDSYIFALRRETFGHALIDNQMIRAKFTLMAGLIETTSSLMEQLVQKSTTVAASDIMFSSSVGLLKIQAGRALEAVSRESQQIFGGLAYSRGGKGGRVEQIGRDVRVLVVSGGSEEILTDMVTKLRLRQARAMTKI